MFSNTYPIFEKKRLLKIEMLNNVRDYPRELFEIFYQNYSNGIITGTQLNVKEKYLIISPGILYWSGVPYTMKEELKLVYEATEKTGYLKIKFLEELRGAEKREYLTQVYIDDIPANERSEIELARFKLQTGARLRDQYTDYFDYNTEFDTINRIHAPFAALGKSSIWPEILRVFAKTMMCYPIKNPWDYSFCMTCLQARQGMHYGTVEEYIKVRLQGRQTCCSNQEIYQALGRIIHEATGAGTQRSAEGTMQKKMLLL